jgi:hypothetical protein
VKSARTYFVALHEIAHIVYGPAASGLRLSKEAHAWQWAVSNSLIKTNSAVAAMIARMLGSYLRAAERSNGRMVTPASDHVLWKILAEMEKNSG